MADKKLTDEEREELAKKLDKSLDDFIESKAKNKRNTDFDEEAFDKLLEEHPAFISSIPKEGKLPPLVEALQALKYDEEENEPEELAQNYKEDGNYNFKLKQYRFAITAYTEGLQRKCKNKDLNSQLHGNRAACHFQLGNYRMALNDCEECLKLNENNLKVHIRGIECCFRLKLHDDAMKLCTNGLKVFPTDERILDLENKIRKQKKIDERDKRKLMLNANRKKIENERIWAAILSRNLRMAEFIHPDKLDQVPNLEYLNSAHPHSSVTKVSLDENGKNLVWPVIFLYPEYGQMDFIEKFHENTTFQDHLETIFGPDIPAPPWDESENYKNGVLEIYFEDVPTNSLVSILNSKTLLHAISDFRYIITGGTPSFIILSKNSNFKSNFLARYK
uniref:Cns1/TTC4 wheel domain-containing protein n=1 Tax=Strigamia maritima TaxID=126957 RepID=T1J1X9_STRMM